MNLMSIGVSKYFTNAFIVSTYLYWESIRKQSEGNAQIPYVFWVPKQIISETKDSSVVVHLMA